LEAPRNLLQKDRFCQIRGGNDGFVLGEIFKASIASLNYFGHFRILKEVGLKGLGFTRFNPRSVLVNFPDKFRTGEFFVSPLEKEIIIFADLSFPPFNGFFEGRVV